MVVASIESQIKSLRDTMKEYLSLLETVDKLREKEEQKTVARGSQDVNGLMKKFM
jgi:prefoldin subunit 5